MELQLLNSIIKKNQNGHYTSVMLEVGDQTGSVNRYLNTQEIAELNAEIHDEAYFLAKIGNEYLQSAGMVVPTEETPFAEYNMSVENGLTVVTPKDEN